MIILLPHLVSNDSLIPFAFHVMRLDECRAIIGDLARAMGSIPVERPQDVKFKGIGKLIA